MIAREHDAVGLWAASERRRRMVSLVVLGLLAGVSAGLAMASVAGARRSDDAYERLRVETRASDAVVFASQVGLAQPDWTDVAALPYVTDAGAFGIGFGTDSDAESLFLPAWGPWLDTVDRPRVVDGRLPDPDDPNEVVLARGRDGSSRFDVGDRVEVSLMTFDAETFAPVEPYEAEVEVVGITSSPFELTALPGDESLFAGPAFERVVADLQAEGRLVGWSNLLVRLEDPARDVPRLREDARRILAAQHPDQPLDELPVLDLADSSKRVTNGTDLERDGLLLFAAAVATAGLLLVAQALSRSIRAATGDLPTLVGMGMTRAELNRGLVRSHRAAVVVAAAAAAAVSFALSPAFPIGLSRQVDPDVGWHVDGPVLVGGVLLVVAVLAVGLRLSARAAVRADQPAGPGRRVAPLIARSPLPVPMVVGAGLALDPGRGARALPTRPALFGAVFGVAGVVGALTLAVGIGDASRPERFGTTWHAEVTGNATDESDVSLALEEMDDIRTRAVADPEVDGVATMMRGHLHVAGTSQPAYSIAVDDGVLDYTVMDGRRPDRPGEIALGPSTARDLGVAVGDEVEIGKGHLARGAEVVGLALLVQTPHSSFDQGVWVTESDLVDAGGLEPLESEAAPYPLLAIRFRDPDRAEALTRGYADGVSERVMVGPSEVPPDGDNLSNVRVLPFLFAVFTALLAAGVVGHVAASTVRRRRHDLAVLRALGFTPRQIWTALLSQATTLAVIGVVVGTPLGVAAGQLAWRAVTDAVPMIYVAPRSLVAVLLVPPLALLVANLLAAGPAQLAARAPTASVLRSE